MNSETKRKIIKVVAGTAIAAAITFGVAYGGPSIKDAIDYGNTEIVYNDENYKLGNLYILSKEDSKEICYKKAISSKTEVGLKSGINMGSGIIMGMDGSMGLQIGGDQTAGNLTIGVVTSSKTTYGYISLDTKEVVAISGIEEQFGYTVKPAKTFISFEAAEENDFQFSQEEFDTFVSDNKGISK